MVLYLIVVMVLQYYLNHINNQNVYVSLFNMNNNIYFKLSFKQIKSGNKIKICIIYNTYCVYIM